MGSQRGSSSLSSSQASSVREAVGNYSTSSPKSEPPKIEFNERKRRTRK